MWVVQRNSDQSDLMRWKFEDPVERCRVLSRLTPPFVLVISVSRREPPPQTARRGCRYVNVARRPTLSLESFNPTNAMHRLGIL